jgi:hypothetical protein
MAPMPETLVPLDEVRKMKRSASSHSIEAKGESGTEDYQIRAYDEATGRTISLWHDVSLVHIDPETQQPTPYLNFVCEIPKFTRYGDSQTSNATTNEMRLLESFLDNISVVVVVVDDDDNDNLSVDLVSHSSCFSWLSIYRKKFEIATSMDGNPIVQDKKNGVLREVQ